MSLEANYQSRHAAFSDAALHPERAAGSRGFVARLQLSVLGAAFCQCLRVRVPGEGRAGVFSVEPRVPAVRREKTPRRCSTSGLAWRVVRIRCINDSRRRCTSRLAQRDLRLRTRGRRTLSMFAQQKIVLLPGCATRSPNRLKNQRSLAIMPIKGEDLSPRSLDLSPRSLALLPPYTAARFIARPG